MDSIKDLLSQLKKSGDENTDNENEGQSKLFDTSKLKTNPKKVFGNKYKYVTKEYQVYGLRLAKKLGDPDRATMYIKWAKEKKRGLLDNALSFTDDYPDAKDKSRIFMWKVKQLEEESKQKSSDEQQKESSE